MLDNLFVGFAGDEVMTVAEGDGVTVQNCEVGWVGGIVAVYNTGEAATGYGGGIQRLAGAIGGGNHGTRYRNNYVHHMLQSRMERSSAVLGSSKTISITARI